MKPINPLCAKCRRSCKQVYQVVACPKYQAEDKTKMAGKVKRK